MERNPYRWPGSPRLPTRPPCPRCAPGIAPTPGPGQRAAPAGAHPSPGQSSAGLPLPGAPAEPRRCGGTAAGRRCGPGQPRFPAGRARPPPRPARPGAEWAPRRGAERRAGRHRAGRDWRPSPARQRRKVPRLHTAAAARRDRDPARVGRGGGGPSSPPPPFPSAPPSPRAGSWERDPRPALPRSRSRSGLGAPSGGPGAEPCPAGAAGGIQGPSRPGAGPCGGAGDEWPRESAEWRRAGQGRARSGPAAPGPQRRPGDNY